MDRIRIVDVTDLATFGLLPPCADPAFDHRTCDYWEDADRGSKAHRPAWLTARTQAGGGTRRPDSFNPFAPAESSAPPANPFAPTGRTVALNPLLDDAGPSVEDNPFAPARPSRPAGAGTDAPRKLAILSRGAGVVGSYAKVLLADDGEAERSLAYAQFGPLSAYPRAMRTRELYPRLPQSPPPAVITCIATTAEGRGRGLALRLVEAICADLAGRGFSAVEAYPELARSVDATSAATPAFWLRAGFAVAVDDEHFPV
ncbi:MAG: GNAT family N-acetyltransferase, partial [Chloroflexi bacterium]|nr:GNAT family N-acetyltransferase [Chloroflexota bacterium]